MRGARIREGRMMRLLQSSWMACLIGGLLFLGTTFALLSPSKFADAHAAPAQKRFVNNEVSWKFHNPEYDQWVAELHQEKEAVALKEQQLQELQKRLEAERIELTSVTQTVAQMQIEFDKNVIRFNTQKQDSMKRQAKLMTTLSPEAAVSLLGEMSDDDVVRLFFLMKTDQVTPLIELMSKAGASGTKRAATLTERLSRVLPAEVNNSRSAPSP